MVQELTERAPCGKAAGHRIRPVGTVPINVGAAVRSICLYTPSADPSGMGAHMVDLAAQLVATGWRVTLMAWPTLPGQRLLAGAEAAGATAVATPHPRDPDFGNTITRYLREHPSDIFHVHVGTGVEDFDGARAARRAGVPTVVQTQHLPWMLHSRGKRKSFFRGIEPVDRLITVSVAQRATYARIGVPANLMATVPNGVRPRGPGLGRREARARLGLRPDQPVVMTIGRLTTMKGQRYLIDAVPSLLETWPDLAVVLVGRGHLHDALVAQAAELGVGDSVRLVGHRPDARALLDAADVFVLPSRHEGMPLAALEAMDAGLPVVGTKVIGTAEVVSDHESGLLVPARDPGALSAAIGRLLSDTDLREKYGAAGRRRYLEHFTAQRMAANTVAVYEQAMSAVAAVSAALPSGAARR